MRRAIMLCAFALVCTFAEAQTATISGQINDPSTFAANKTTQVEFSLKGCGGNAPRYNGTAALVGDTSGSDISITFPVNNLGQISAKTGGTLTIYRNDYITCGTSTDSNMWAMTIIRNGMRGSPCNVRITTTTFDATQPSCLNQNPTLPVVSDTTVFAKIDASNLPFTGHVRAPKIEDIRFSDRFASISAACADLSGLQGTVMIPSSVAASDPTSGFTSKCTLLDWRGTGAFASGAWSANHLNGLGVAERFSATTTSSQTRSLLNIFTDVYSGGTNASGNKSTFTPVRIQTLRRTDGQLQGLESAVNDESMGDTFPIAAIIDTSGGNKTGIGDEGKVAIRARVTQQNNVFTATVSSVNGNVITYSSPVNEVRVGEDRFLIASNTGTGSCAGSATTSANSTTITEAGGGADFESCTNSGVLDSGSNPRWGFALTSEVVNSTLKHVIPITAVAAGGTTATLRDAWPAFVTGTTGAFKIYKGSIVSSVDPDNNTITVTDGTQFLAGDTIELPLDNRFNAYGIFINMEQQIATSGPGVVGLAFSNTGSDSGSSAPRARWDNGITFGGDVNEYIEISGVSIRPASFLTYNAGPAPSTWFNFQDNVNNSTHTMIGLKRNSGTDFAFTYLKNGDELRFSNQTFVNVVPASASSNEFRVSSGGVPHFQVGDAASFLNNAADLYGNSGNQSGEKWRLNSTTGSLTSTTANGAQWIRDSASESITLSTSGTTTDSSANLLPANSIIEAVGCRITTTITTATDWSVGDPTTAARFSSANATLTSGTTSVGLNHMKGGVATDAAGPTQTSAAKLRITTTGTPGAGVIRCTVWYQQFVPPTS